jgi:metal-responsive CopG/Arc/MetJ family transcriptional regulator
MKANHSSGVAVKLPDDLRAILDGMAQKRGESLSLIIRDLLRRGTADPQTVNQIMGGGSPVTARDFK